MTFGLFGQAAVVPKELWPRGYGVNGWVRLEGRKMSKSKGNVWYSRDAVHEWGADPVRMAVANAGDGLDDPNLDLASAATATARLREWFRFATGRPRSRQERHGIDAWFLSVLNRAIQATRASMEEMNYKTALRHGYFDIQSAWSWYVRRSEGRPSAEVLRRFIEIQTKLLAPFAPHATEEIWHRIGGEGFVVNTAYPVAIADEIDPRAEAAESLLQGTLADVREILKVTRIQPKRIALYTAPDVYVRVKDSARVLANECPIRMYGLIERALAQH